MTPKENQLCFEGWQCAVSAELELVRQERLRQLEKWGLQRHSFAQWSLILGEEVGELCEKMIEVELSGMPKSQPFPEIREEAIQVAAVALAIAQACSHRAV